ncbi:MAG: zinc ribbon domain-containing protein [Phycisphaerae bacterium]|nr:zinc ribbon domain-containing protein [Phycisphaerae bacterium]NUQ44481.1 zinc ribbon domain-containing protein [Phycisphaerae bacterium]
MPTYEYECQHCRSVFDVFQSITAKPLRKYECASCRKTRPVKRRLGAGAALIFRGSGFYHTDYRSESFKKAAKAEKDAATGGSTNDAAKSPATPAADKPAKTAAETATPKNKSKAPKSA